MTAGAALIGAAGAFFAPAVTGLIPQTASPGRLQQANALMSLSRSSTGILGPIGRRDPGGDRRTWLGLRHRRGDVRRQRGLAVAASAPESVTPEARRGFLAEVAAGWHEVASRRWLLAAILTFGISNVAMGPVYVLAR